MNEEDSNCCKHMLDIFSASYNLYTVPQSKKLHLSLLFTAFTGPYSFHFCVLITLITISKHIFYHPCFGQVVP